MFHPQNFDPGTFECLRPYNPPLLEPDSYDLQALVFLNRMKRSKTQCWHLNADKNWKPCFLIYLALISTLFYKCTMYVKNFYIATYDWLYWCAKWNLPPMASPWIFMTNLDWSLFEGQWFEASDFDHWRTEDIIIAALLSVKLVYVNYKDKH